VPMVALLSNAAFDSETTQLLGAAFEAGWEKVKTSGSALAQESQAALTRELLAKRIIEMAKRGERNPDRLVENALDHLVGSQATPDSAITTTSAALSRAMPGC
jgi:tagatose-1,6-bisphosphate aldolase non-catalytic subunit AgaZ/GatZ